MSSNKENIKQKVEGEKVTIEKAAATDNKEEEKTDLVSDELWKIESLKKCKSSKTDFSHFSLSGLFIICNL